MQLRYYAANTINLTPFDTLYADVRKEIQSLAQERACKNEYCGSSRQVSRTIYRVIGEHQGMKFIHIATRSRALHIYHSNRSSQTRLTSYRSSAFHTFEPSLDRATILLNSEIIRPGPLAYTVVLPQTVSSMKSLTRMLKSGCLWIGSSCGFEAGIAVF